MKRYHFYIFGFTLALFVIAALVLLLSPTGKQPQTFSAWINEPGQEETISSIERHGEQLFSISPMWYKIDENGDFVEIWKGDPRIVKTAKQKNVLLIPSIANQFDPKRASLVLRSPQRRRALATQISNLVKAERFDGVDLDFENLYPEDRRDYISFVSELKKRLASTDAVLSVTVQPKTVDSQGWAGVQALDYRALGKIADQIRIMAYDQHHSSGPPGPIASVDWVGKVIKYAARRVPKKKLILGVPLYGYDWSEPGQGSAVDFESAHQKAEEIGATIMWDKQAASPYFTYSENGKDHIVWFENARSVAAKLNVKGTGKLTGYSFFRLGIEDPGIWTAMAKRADRSR